MRVPEQGVSPEQAWVPAPGGLPELEEAHIAASDCLEVAQRVKALGASALVVDAPQERA